MTKPYKLSSREPLPSNHPLHWTKFWPDLQRVHRSKIEARQDLILWLANLWNGAVKRKTPLGFCSIQLRLMDLRKWVRDYKRVLEYFFEVKQLGYRVDEENQEISTLIPRALQPEHVRLVHKLADQLVYTPPALPDDAVISKVYVQQGLDRKRVLKQCLAAGRPELIPQVMWILGQRELNMHFVRSGKLQLRDTSVWPISGIENWPGWLREELFGPGIDLDSAYVQFLMQHLNRTFSQNPDLLSTLFPDLLRLLHDKEAFRKELCTQVLHRPYNKRYKAVMKQVLMSLANGSRISPALLTNGSGFSLTADLIHEAAPEAQTSELMEIGARLQRISAQFASARKYACLSALGSSPNRANVKKVFGSYFAWEREARYALWEEVGRHGIMMHDGLDGVPQEYIDELPEIMNRLSLKLTA